jgi:SPP1 family predicted phage head-tail adaptor
VPARMPQPGELNRRVLLQQPTRTADAYSGGAISGWRTVAEVWAKIEPLQGSELWAARAVRTDLSHTVTIRYRADLAADWRIVHGPQAFNVSGPPVDIDDARRYLACPCSQPGAEAP